MSDPTRDLEAWAACYRAARRPSPARRRAIRAAVLEAAAHEDRRIRQQRWVGLGIIVAAGVLAALAIGQLLGGRSMAAGAERDPMLAPHGATMGEPAEGFEIRSDESSPRAATPPVTDSAPTIEEPAPAASTPATAAATSTSTKPRRVEPARPSVVAPVAGSRALDDLESMRLLREAERRLEHDAAASLRLLERHAQQFPGSSLALEREALTVIALCSVGQMKAGRERQRLFLRANGQSAYAARVAGACTVPPSAEP